MTSSRKPWQRCMQRSEQQTGASSANVQKWTARYCQSSWRCISHGWYLLLVQQQQQQLVVEVAEATFLGQAVALVQHQEEQQQQQQLRCRQDQLNSSLRLCPTAAHTVQLQQLHSLVQQVAAVQPLLQ
jgi:hypothetical protein